MTRPYDSNNVFAKILREELACKSFYQNDFIAVFPDIKPEAPTHLLMIPKGPYKDFYHFMKEATELEIAGFFRGVQEVIEQLGLEEGGYRLITNAGESVGKTVFHFHLHLLAGKSFSHL